MIIKLYNNIVYSANNYSNLDNNLELSTTVSPEQEPIDLQPLLREESKRLLTSNKDTCEKKLLLQNFLNSNQTIHH